MYRRLTCAKTGLPIMSAQEAAECGLPELGKVCVVFDDNSRLDELDVAEGITHCSSATFGDIDLELVIEQNVARLVLAEFADDDLNFYDLACNDADVFDLTTEVVRDRLEQLRSLQVPLGRIDSGVRMMA